MTDPADRAGEGAAEARAIARRYARRAPNDRYGALNPDVWQTLQERQRALLRLFARLGWTTLADKTLVEVGCGSGGNLLELLRLGFEPQHLVGIELLADRAAEARRRLPALLRIVEGDATALPVANGPADASQQVVFVSTVFSSLLDAPFRQRLADTMWRWVAPGGGVLWYDFTVDNPRNPDVRGVPAAAVRALFPEGRASFERVTLAPPIARAVTRVHPALYRAFNALPPLRTHLLGWIGKGPARPTADPLTGGTAAPPDGGGATNLRAASGRACPSAINACTR
jgi:SAM-dependent methyltransferase